MTLSNPAQPPPATARCKFWVAHHIFGMEDWLWHSTHIGLLAHGQQTTPKRRTVCITWPILFVNKRYWTRNGAR